jgi:hypothetical protein
MRPEPVQVQLHDGRPTRFVWRERLYTVLAVLERPGEHGPTEHGPGGRGPGEQSTSVPGREADEHEHEATRWRCWRVMAAPGKNVPAAGFRLCQDPDTERWQLTRDSG